jgi:hypothetical protein
MGLLYIFPNSDEASEIDNDRVLKTADSITLKSYGLPMIFWVYLAAIYVVVFTMWLTIKSALDKMLTYDDASMIFLYWLVKGTLLGAPLVLLAFFFYEKFITKNKTNLTITHRIFFIPVWHKKIILDSTDALTVDHFLDSPNIAKMNSQTETKGFENKGYFELHAKSNGKAILIDRHSQKRDLIKMQELLNKY